MPQDSERLPSFISGTINTKVIDVDALGAQKREEEREQRRQNIKKFSLKTLEREAARDDEFLLYYAVVGPLPYQGMFELLSHYVTDPVSARGMDGGDASERRLWKAMGPVLDAVIDFKDQEVEKAARAEPFFVQYQSLLRLLYTQYTTPSYQDLPLPPLEAAARASYDTARRYGANRMEQVNGGIFQHASDSEIPRHLSQRTLAHEIFSDTQRRIQVQGSFDHDALYNQLADFKKNLFYDTLLYYLSLEAEPVWMGRRFGPEMEPLSMEQALQLTKEELNQMNFAFKISGGTEHISGVWNLHRRIYERRFDRAHGYRNHDIMMKLGVRTGIEASAHNLLQSLSSFTAEQFWRHVSKQMANDGLLVGQEISEVVNADVCEFGNFAYWYGYMMGPDYYHKREKLARELGSHFLGWGYGKLSEGSAPAMQARLRSLEASPTVKTTNMSYEEMRQRSSVPVMDVEIHDSRVGAHLSGVYRMPKGLEKQASFVPCTLDPGVRQTDLVVDMILTTSAPILPAFDGFEYLALGVMGRDGRPLLPTQYSVEQDEKNGFVRLNLPKKDVGYLVSADLALGGESYYGELPVELQSLDRQGLKRIVATLNRVGLPEVAKEIKTVKAGMPLFVLERVLSRFYTYSYDDRYKEEDTGDDLADVAGYFDKDDGTFHFQCDGEAKLYRGVVNAYFGRNSPFQAVILDGFSFAGKDTNSRVIRLSAADAHAVVGFTKHGRLLAARELFPARSEEHEILSRPATAFEPEVARRVAGQKEITSTEGELAEFWKTLRATDGVEQHIAQWAKLDGSDPLVTLYRVSTVFRLFEAGREEDSGRRDMLLDKLGIEPGWGKRATYRQLSDMIAGAADILTMQRGSPERNFYNSKLSSEALFSIHETMRSLDMLLRQV